MDFMSFSKDAFNEMIKEMDSDGSGDVDKVRIMTAAIHREHAPAKLRLLASMLRLLASVRRWLSLAHRFCS